MTEPFLSDDISIIGMSCILPDAYDPRAFWNNLISEKSAIKEISDERIKTYIIEQGQTSRLKITSRLAAEISLNDYRELIIEEKDPAHRINRQLDCLASIGPVVGRRYDGNDQPAVRCKSGVFPPPD